MPQPEFWPKLNNMKFPGLNKPPKTPIKDVVRIISIDENGQVLLVQEVDDPNWKYPGGKIHPEETILDAVMRESNEELGFQVLESDIINYVSATIPDSEHYRHMILVKYIEPSRISRTDEVAQFGYFDLDNLPETHFEGHIRSGAKIVLTKPAS